MNTLEQSLKSLPRLDILAELRQTIGKNDLRKQYLERPITMHKTFPTKEEMKWPTAIRQAYRFGTAFTANDTSQAYQIRIRHWGAYNSTLLAPLSGRIRNFKLFGKVLSAGERTVEGKKIDSSWS